MPSVWQFFIVGILIVGAALGALASLAPVRWRLALADGLDGRVPDAVLSRLRPRGGCGSCGSPPRAP